MPSFWPTVYAASPPSSRQFERVDTVFEVRHEKHRNDRAGDAHVSSGPPRLYAAGHRRGFFPERRPGRPADRLVQYQHGHYPACERGHLGDARQTPAFDYGTAIPRNRIYQVRSVAGVAWAQGLFMGWNTWSRPDGLGITVEVVGLEDELVGGPWKMHKGPIAAVLHPETVVVDHLYAEALGVARVGEEVEIQGIRAVVGGITEGVRTFTAAPFVFTAIGTAIRFDKRYRDDEVTYVMVRCRPGFSPEWVKKRIQLSVPHVEVLTSEEFAVRSAKYWMLETGIGLTIVVTAALGVLVGVFIMSQTLFAITQDNLASYATLAALGFSLPRLASIVLFQGTVLGSGGIAAGGLLFLAAIRASATCSVNGQTVNVPGTFAYGSIDDNVIVDGSMLMPATGRASRSSLHRMTASTSPMSRRR